MFLSIRQSWSDDVVEGVLDDVVEVRGRLNDRDAESDAVAQHEELDTVRLSIYRIMTAFSSARLRLEYTDEATGASKSKSAYCSHAAMMND